MARYEGNPAILVRLPPEVLEEVRQKAEARFPSQVGRGGGIAHFIRCLVYRDLGRSEPEAWASHISPRKLKKFEKEKKEKAKQKE